MSVFIDRKYLGMLSHKLERYTQKNADLYNFRCPFCLDSQKNRSKARGYIYRKGNDYFFRCHNCSVSISFQNFLKELDGTAYKQYTLERYSSGESGHSNYKKPTFDNLRGNTFARLVTNKKRLNIQSIADLPENHYAKEYIKNRCIPTKFWSEIYFTETFKDFLDLEFPDHGKDMLPNDDRIVLLYTNEDGDITNVAGRALSDNKMRYITVKITDEKKVFGLHRMSRKDRVYVFEGQFDSFFIPNSVASGDSNLCGVGTVLVDCDVVLVYDNEPRNKEIVKQVNKAIEEDFKVCLFPESIPYKDVNDMIMGGMSTDVLKTIIDSNTSQGLAAKMKFITWKKC